jgi:hypothetical protein
VEVWSREELVEALCGYEEAPFTTQRLCELLLEPNRHYGQLGKFIHAVSKVCGVWCVGVCVMVCDGV